MTGFCGITATSNWRRYIITDMGQGTLLATALSHLLTISWCLGHLGQESVRGTSMQWVEAVCKDLGLALAAHKCEGNTDLVTFVGIELNTQRMVMWLPQD